MASQSALLRLRWHKPLGQHTACDRSMSASFCDTTWFSALVSHPTEQMMTRCPSAFTPAWS